MEKYLIVRIFTVIIKFNRRIYKIKAIKSAIKEFKKLADFSLSQKENYIYVSLTNIDKDIKNIIKDEFCNFVLFHMNN